MNLTSIKWLTACACSLVLVVAITGCSKGDSDVGGDVKLGTDKLPQAPNQGTPPGTLGKDGKPSEGGGPAVAPLPGNKGKH
jgi:hypothetical protein